MYFDRNLLSFIVLFGIVSVSYADSGVEIVNGNYTGMSTSCNNCTVSRYEESYDCSSSPNWNDGIRNFQDPVPANHTVVSIDVSLYITFNCENYTSPDTFSLKTGVVTVADAVVGFMPNITGKIRLSFLKNQN